MTGWTWTKTSQISNLRVFWAALSFNFYGFMQIWNFFFSGSGLGLGFLLGLGLWGVNFYFFDQVNLNQNFSNFKLKGFLSCSFVSFLWIYSNLNFFRVWVRVRVRYRVMGVNFYFFDRLNLNQNFSNFKLEGFLSCSFV